MTTHAACYEIQLNQGPSGLAINPQSVITGAVSDLPGNGSGPNGAGFWQTDVLPHPLIVPSGFKAGDNVQYVKKVIGEMGIVGQTGGLGISTHSGNIAAGIDPTFWNIGGPTFNNGTVPGIQSRIAPDQGRTAPPAFLLFNDAAGSAIFGGGTPELAELHIEYGYQAVNPYMTLSHFIDFQEQPPDDDDDGRQALTRLLDGFQNSAGRFSVGTDANGSQVFAEGCAYAAVAPEGAVYIRAEDFGSPDPSGIPSDATSNTGARFRFHPSVFIRRAQYIRGVSRPYSDPTAVNVVDGFGQVFNVIIVDPNPIESLWLIAIDGQHQLVRLLHPANSDIQRPLDIWNQVWVPLIQGSQATVNATGFRLLPPGGFGNQTNIEQLSNRLQFLEYARCLPLPGTAVTQVQGGPPPP